MIRILLPGIFLSALVLLVLCVYFIRKRIHLASQLRRLRANWGRPKSPTSGLDFEQVSLYHRLKRSDVDEYIDDQTWQALDLSDVFVFLDRTNSRPGQQFLYHQIRAPKFDQTPLLKFESLVETFRTAELREKLQLDLSRLNDDEALLLPNLFLDELPHPSNSRYLLLFLLLITIALLIASFLSTSFLLPLFVLASVNMVMTLLFRRTFRYYVQPLRQLNLLLSTAQSVSRHDEVALADYRQELSHLLGTVSTLRRRTAWLTFDRDADQLSGMLYHYISMAFLVDVNCFVFGLDQLRKRRREVEKIFEILGYLDAALSVASVRESKEFTTPVFLPRQKQCAMRGIYHPLLERAVPGDLLVDGKGILITGSNMSGKSTLIRAVGVNAILAQTIHTCFATEVQLPFLMVHASIGSSDSLLAGKSYYLSEVEAILKLIEASASSRQQLFLIDELFRGTNSTERVGASRAVLKFLNRRDSLVVAATHDLQLVELLGGIFEFVHFRETLENGQMKFDYVLHSGTCSTRNAIAILAIAGYPDELVADATEYVEQLKVKS